MKEYFILDFAAGTRETGLEFPQVQEMGKGYDYDANNSVYELGKCLRALPDFQPNLDHFVLNRNAKPSDLLSNSLINTTGFLLSNVFKDVLCQFNLPNHKYYSAKVYYKGKLLDNYFWLQMVSDFTDYVDYINSTFFLYKNYSRDIGDIEISSKEDYIEKSKIVKNEDSTLSVWAKKISFTKEFDKKLDLFSISRFNGNIFISKELSQSLLEKQLTGLEIRSTEIFKI